MAIESNKLPLPLERRTTSAPPSNVLKLPLGAQNITPVEPQPHTGTTRLFTFASSDAKQVSQCNKSGVLGGIIARCHKHAHSESSLIQSCKTANVSPFFPISQCAQSNYTLSKTISNCLRNDVENFVPISNCSSVTNDKAVGYQSCYSAITQSAQALHYCNYNELIQAVGYQSCYKARYGGASLSNCEKVVVTKAVPVPCRFYPIPEPPPLPEIRACRIRPPSNRLPLPLRRPRQNLPSNVLPLPLTCWHDEPVLPIPNLPTYIMHNTVTATIGGISVEPLSFDFKTDMDSYCWSGGVTISHSDYEKVKSKLEKPKGEEPLIVVVVNNERFAIIAEEFSRSRQLANYSYTLSGRSITARLGEDYAKAQEGLLDQPNYASQIVNQQLSNLLISVEKWEVADWLIPANQYAVTEKTPISVIREIAQACGGFVETHPSQATLSLKRRWKANAWDLATAAPDVILPFDIPRQVNDKKTINTRYNTATLVSDVEAGNVFRQPEGRDIRAPISTNPLYTDRDCIVPAGEAILSDSGIHQHYIFTMMWANKYNVFLAKLGEIWQFNDENDGAWRGIVQGVGVSGKQENNAPVVLQTVTVDRYLDT